MNRSKSRPALVISLAVLVTVPLQLERAHVASAEISPETIAAAIAAAPAGGTVTVEAGTYVEDLTIDKPLTLSCANAGVSAGATPGTRGDESTIQGQLTVTAAGVVIDGCRFVRPDVSSSEVPRLVRSVGLTSEVTVRNSVFDLTDSAAGTRGTRGCGAGISGTAAWRVSDSLFRNHFYNQFTDACGSPGQRYTSRMIFADNAQPVVIEGSRFESVSQAIFLTGPQPSGSVILNNLFTGSSALFMGTTSDVLIKGNTLTGSGGFYLDGSQDTTIENNLLEVGSTYLVYSVGATAGTAVRNNAILGRYTFGGADFEGRGMFNLAAGTMDATDNWWGVTTVDEISATIRQVGEVTFEPWLTSDETVANPTSRYTTGFWPPSAVDPVLPSAPATLPTPLLSGGVPPTVTPGSATLVSSDGEESVPDVRVDTANPLGVDAVVVSTPDLLVAVTGDRGATAPSGAIASQEGEIVSRIEADIPVGSVVEVWLFSTPRLVAAARVDVAGQVDIVVPVSAPLDGGGPIEPGVHTMQLLIPASGGLVAVNVGVTVGGPVPTSVPSGISPSVPPGLVWLCGLAVLVLGVDLLRRMAIAASPA